MKRSGMRWSSDGAEAMVKMRAVYLSRDFEEYWTGTSRGNRSVSTQNPAGSPPS